MKAIIVYSICGSCGITPTTIVDLTGEEPVIARRGKGDVALFGA